MIEGWHKVSVGDIGKIVSGGTPDSTNPAYWDGDIPWATQTDITNLTSRYISSTARRITEAGLKSSSAKLVPPGSILVCTRATIGELAIASEPVCTNQGFKNLITNPEYDNEFVFYLLSFFKNILVRYASGSTFLELTKKDFEKLVFTIPPLLEQRKIARILSTWDEAIETIEELIKKSEDQKKALMQMSTGKCQLLKSNEKWSRVKLADIGRTYNGLSGKSKEDFGFGSPFLPYNNVFENDKVDITLTKQVSVKPAEKQNLVNKGDILFTISSETPNEVGMSSVVLDNPGRLYLNSFCFGFRLREDCVGKLLPEFARFYFRSPSIRRQIIGLTQGELDT